MKENAKKTMTEDTDILSIYTDELITLSETARSTHRLANPDVTATVVSPICGSSVTVDLNTAGDTITAFGFDSDSCALTRTVLAVMRHAIIDKTHEDVAAVGRIMQEMLAGKGNHPKGDWEKLSLLAAVKDFPARHNALMLPFEAVGKALTQSPLAPSLQNAL